MGRFKEGRGEGELKSSLPRTEPGLAAAGLPVALLSASSSLARTLSANTPPKIIASGHEGPTASNPLAEGRNLYTGAPAPGCCGLPMRTISKAEITMIIK